jgi:NitT/TauT family transport system permease protein
MRRLATFLVFAALVCVAWEILVRMGAWREVLLPRPTRVASYLWQALGDGSLADSTLVTARRLFAGYAIGITIGLPLGVLSARVRWFRDSVGVLSLGLQTLPSVCWVPMALLWFGQSESAMLFVVVMGTTWALLLATEAGVRSLPPVFVRAARTMGSTGMHTVVQVLLPAAFPAIVSGLKQGWAFAWRSLMAAEIFVTILTGFGLGHLLHYGRELHAMDQVLGVMAVIVAVGLLAEYALFQPAERWLRRRWGLSG